MARRKKDSVRKSRRRVRGSSPLLRRLVLWSLAAAAALVLLGFVGYAQLLSYLQGEAFKASLEKELCNQARAESVELAAPLSLDGNRISLPGVQASRPGFLHHARVNRVYAEVDRPALFDRELHLTRFSLEEGSLMLHADAIGEHPPGIRKGRTNFWSRFVPTKLRIDRVDCEDFDTTLRLAGRDYRLTSTTLSARPASRFGKGAWELQLSSGRLHSGLPLLGDGTLKSATGTLSEKAIGLSQGRLMLSPGELVTNAVYDKESGKWSADLRVNHADLERLTGSDWKKRLSGRFYGRMGISGRAGELERAEGHLSLQEGVLEALPILSELTLNGTRPYRTLKLEKATARLSYPYADAALGIRRAWMLDQLDLRAEGGLLRVKGHALVDEDGSLSGTLLIGLPKQTAQSLLPLGGELAASLFNASGDAGYAWMRMNLSGTLEAPQEDLSVRFKTLLSSLQEAASHVVGRLFSPTDVPADGKEGKPAQPTQPEPPKEGSGKLLQGAGDAAQEVIGSGLRALF